MPEERTKIVRIYCNRSEYLPPFGTWPTPQEFAAAARFTLHAPPLGLQDGRLHNLLTHCQDEPDTTR